MYVSGGIDEKALNVSNTIIEQLRSNHEGAATRMLLHVDYQARQSAKRVIVANQDNNMLFFYLYIILVTWVYVKYSLKLEDKVPMQI